MLKERIVGSGVLVIGLVLFFGLIPIGIDSPSNLDHITLFPDFWPRIISAIFALTGFIILVKPGAPPTNTEDDIDPSSWSSRIPRLVIVLSTLFAFYFLIEYLGMVVPGILVIFGMMWFAGERRYILMGSIAVAVPVMLYVFFVHVANIPIPLGLFEFLRG
ncbi:MAG: putative tricarboxylic transport membrane protein [Gammaproteobacteria bacterium]|jgi:putative tricarboxylic transport membrane protein